MAKATKLYRHDNRQTRHRRAECKAVERNVQEQHRFLHELVYGQAACLLPAMYGRFTQPRQGE